MTYDTERVTVGRKPVLLCELELDKCANTYGSNAFTTTPTNVITQGENFNHSDWTNITTTVSNVTAAPVLPYSFVGGVTADTLEDDNGAGWENALQTVSDYTVGSYYCVSVYILKDAVGMATRFPMLRISHSGSTLENNDISLDTATGDVSTTFASTSGISGVESIGLYWRLYISAQSADGANTVGTFNLYPAVGDTTLGVGGYTNTATGTITAWGAVATEGDILYEYEKSHGNLLTSPEDFSHDDWTKNNAPVIVDDADTAPNGTVTADTIEDDDATAFESLSQSASAFTVSNYYVASLYIKKDAVGRATRFPMVRLGFAGSTTEHNDIKLDTSTGEFSTSFESTAGVFGVQSAGDYWRVYISAKSGDGSNTSAFINPYPAHGASATWTASNTATGTITAWGAQLTVDDTIHDYGVANCSVAGAAGTECYNTRATCQDLPNYNPVVPKVYTLSNVLVPGENFLNCIDSTQLAPTVISPDKGLGIRASIKVTLADFPHHDRGIDPYVSTRPYTPQDQGTFFNKLFARNLHAVGRPLRIKTGYIGDTFSIVDFQTRNYVIDGITGPDPKGKFTVTSKDVLVLADDARSVAPATSTGKLTGGLTTSTASLTVTADTELEYVSEKYVRIGDELILAPLANRAANVFSNLTRAQWNTEASAHDTGDTVQSCKWLNSANVVDLVYDLLVNYADIDTSYITTADWDSERDTWYSTATISTVISEPTGVNELINDLAEQFFFQIWWDEINQKILFKPIVPPAFGATITDINDDGNLLDNSVMLTRDAKKRLSRVVVYYNPRTPIETQEPKDYKSFYARIDADAESDNEYGDIRQKIIFARFIGVESLAVQTGGRLLSRYRNSPRNIKFKLDAKDSSLVTGDLTDIESRAIQGVTGAANKSRFQITSFKELARPVSGTHYEYTGIEVSFFSRYAYIGPNSLSTYDVESDANKALYSFIALDTGLFSDATDAYRII